MTRGLTREAERSLRLQAVLGTLKQAEANDIELSVDKLTYEIQFRYGITEPVAREYIKIALSQTNGQDIDGTITWKKKTTDL